MKALIILAGYNWFSSREQVAAEKAKEKTLFVGTTSECIEYAKNNSIEINAGTDLRHTQVVMTDFCFV